MIDKKFSKLLFELSKHSRITSKKLSKLLNISQQSASYTVLNILKKKDILNYQTVIDPARFGLINILVFFDYVNFDSSTTTKIKNYLKSNPYITFIEEISHGADLIVEYCVPNLSLFNKQNREFLYQFKKDIKINGIYVVIVKHIYNHKYLKKGAVSGEIILSGDRDSIELNDKQKEVLKCLRDNAKESILNISKKVNSDPKTVVKIKKYLEKKKVIRKYGIIFNHQKFGIARQHIFLQLNYEDPDEIDKFIKFIKQQKNIISVFKIIGNYDLLILGERLISDKPFIDELRKNFKIINYNVIKGGDILKDNFVPDCVFENC